MSLDTYSIEDYDLIQTRSGAGELKVTLNTDPINEKKFIYWIPEITDHDAVSSLGLFDNCICQYCPSTITTKYTSTHDRFDSIYCCQKCYGLIELMFEYCTNPHPLLTKLSNLDYLPIAKRASETMRMFQELKQQMIQKTFMLTNLDSVPERNCPRELRIIISGHILVFTCETYRLSASSFC